MAYNSKYHFNNLFLLAPIPCENSLVYQLGEIYCSHTSEVPEHPQNFFEFTFVLEGKGIVYTDGSPISVGQYDCYWSIPGENHRIVSDLAQPLRFCYVAYMSRDVNIDNIHTQLFSGPRPLGKEQRIFNDKTLKENFADMLTEISEKPPFLSPMLGSLLKMVIVKAFRHLTNTDTNNYHIDKKDADYLAYQTARYIEQNILKMKSLTELERVLHYNYQYIERNFQKIMNMTLNKYFLNKRMEKATELLSSGTSVTKTAELLQYSCIHTFSRAFEKFFGIPPSHYQ